MTSLRSSGRRQMAPAPPRFAPKSNKEKDELIEWTIARWHELHATTANEESFDEFLASFRNHFRDPKWDVMFCLVANDAALFTRVVRRPSVARHVFHLLGGHAKPFRKPIRHGQHIKEAIKIAIQIENIWDEQFGKHQVRKSNSDKVSRNPGAHHIATLILRLRGVDADARAVGDYRRKNGSASFGRKNKKSTRRPKNPPKRK